MSFKIQPIFHATLFEFYPSKQGHIPPTEDHVRKQEFSSRVIQEYLFSQVELGVNTRS